MKQRWQSAPVNWLPFLTAAPPHSTRTHPRRVPPPRRQAPVGAPGPAVRPHRARPAAAAQPQPRREGQRDLRDAKHVATQPVDPRGRDRKGGRREAYGHSSFAGSKLHVGKVRRMLSVVGLCTWQHNNASRYLYRFALYRRRPSPQHAMPHTAYAVFPFPPMPHVRAYITVSQT